MNKAGVLGGTVHENARDAVVDAFDNLNSKVSDAVGAETCLASALGLAEDNCNAVQYCDDTVVPPTCQFHGWFLGIVAGVIIIALLTIGACLYKCLC